MLLPSTEQSEGLVALLLLVVSSAIAVQLARLAPSCAADIIVVDFFLFGTSAVDSLKFTLGVDNGLLQRVWNAIACVSSSVTKPPTDVSR